MSLLVGNFRGKLMFRGLGTIGFRVLGFGIWGVRLFEIFRKLEGGHWRLGFEG